MSNEKQVADTIEMLYKRLNSHNKQALFNYGYLLEINEILCKDIEEKGKENKRLNNIIKEALNYIDDNTYYKDHKGHINIDDLYIILQKGSDKE